jgi:hypothetical protein
VLRFEHFLCLFYWRDYRTTVPGGKARSGRDADHPSHLVTRSRMGWSYISFSLYFCMPVSGKVYFRSWGSSVSIVSDYRLDDRGSIPGRGKQFSSILCVQNSSETHPASYPVGTTDHFLGIKRGRRVTLTTHPHLVPRSGITRYTSSPLSAYMA